MNNICCLLCGYEKLNNEYEIEQYFFIGCGEIRTLITPSFVILDLQSLCGGEKMIIVQHNKNTIIRKHKSNYCCKKISFKEEKDIYPYKNFRQYINSRYDRHICPVFWYNFNEDDNIDLDNVSLRIDDNDIIYKVLPPIQLKME